MMLINVKMVPRPEYRENFRELVNDFTVATRQEPGCLWFDWYRGVDEDNQDVYFLCEAFQDDAAGDHVNSEHFQQACEDMPQWLASTPEIINTTIEGATHWDRMAEFQVEES